MPFVLIKGRYEPEAGTPDGDSVRFQADNPNNWKKLDGRPVKIGTGVETAGTVQLRFEDRNERIDLLDIGEERGLQDVVKVTGKKVSLTEPPENIRVRGKAGRPSRNTGRD